MARIVHAVCRICRREGEKLFLKGEKCFTVKCPVQKRSKDGLVQPPGQHGGLRTKTRKKKLSDFGVQLREKQKLRKAYGVLERQFEKYFYIAQRQKGMTGDNLLILLERRLDNAVFRLGFASSRVQARQFVLHGHVLVNGRRVSVPSYLVKPGDAITVKDAFKQNVFLQEAVNIAQSRGIAGWLELNPEPLEGKVVSMPTRDLIGSTAREQLVVEYYSR